MSLQYSSFATRGTLIAASPHSPCSVLCQPTLRPFTSSRPSFSAASGRKCDRYGLQKLLNQQTRSTCSKPRGRALCSMTVSAAGTAPSIGWLGIGTLGMPMVQNLLKAGYDVTVWNRSPARCDPLVEAGAKLGSSPKDVAQTCDVTFAVVADPDAALEVATGPEGVAAGISAGKGYVDVSTIDVASAQKIGEAVHKAGGQYLEAPVSGSKQPAEKGQLIFLTAGDRELFDRVTPLLEVMGKKSFFLGEVGQAAKMKLVINMVMGSMMASFAEGLALAKDTGLSQADLLEATGLGAIAAPMFAMKGPGMTKGEFPPAFPLKHQQKDLRLALELGESVKQQLPVAAAANASYLQALEAGLGDQDFSAVLAILKPAD